MADSPQPGGVKRSFDESTSGSEWTSRKGGHHHRPPSSESPVGGSGGTGGGGGVGGTGGGAGRGGAGGAGRYVLPSILDGTGGRVPTISRKVRACAACKKQKIRCDFEEGETTCVRCKKMKLECVVNRSLQTILDEDVEWKRLMRDDTTQLQRAVEDLLQLNGMRPLAAYSYSADSPVSSVASTTADRDRYPTMSDRYAPDPRYDRGVTSAASTPSATARYPDRYIVEKVKVEDAGSGGAMDHDGNSLVSNPMGSLYEVTNMQQGSRRDLRIGQQHPTEMDGDFVSCGVITQNEGDALFTIFRDSLNHYLFDIALTQDTLEAARASSCLLTAAIFTVSSLHLPGHHHLFPKCLREFLRLVSSSMFDRYHQLDDVRALCIGAFWLADLSWKLSGHAVRIATELGIHQSFRKALAGSPEHFERARLWYLLYVCDHHFSIAYNRPPVIHDHEPMRKYDHYLQSSLAIEGDGRVISQVSLFVVMTRIYNCFEGEPDSEVCDESLSQLAGFNEQLDGWRNTWRARLRRNDFVGDYPVKGVDLHYHFAKLQLNILALRGATSSTIANLSALRKDYATLAIHSASAVLQTVLDEPSIRDALVGVPLYIDTMIAFASVFLLKVTARWKGISFSPLPPTQVWNQIGHIVTLLKEKRAGEQHIIHQLSVGLDKMLSRCVDYANSGALRDDGGGGGVAWDHHHNPHTPHPHSPHHQHHPHPHHHHHHHHPVIPRSVPPPYHEVPVYLPEGYPHPPSHPPPPPPPPPPQPQSSHSSPQSPHHHPAAHQQSPHTPTHSQGIYPEVSIYDVANVPPEQQQYFSVQMGTYDFLSPQLPY